MDTIGYHIKGITTTLETLFKGKFLVFFIPGLVLTLLFWWVQSYFEAMEAAATLESDYSWLDWIYGWINSGVNALFSMFDLIMEQVYIFMVITVLSPFNTLLAEKLDSQLTGQQFKFGWARFINDIIRMIFLVIIAVTLELLCVITYWMIATVIGIHFLDELVYFCIAAFFFGFSFFDFALERYGVKLLSSLGFAFANPLSMILTGAVFLGIYYIPIAGIPISPVIAVMVSTIVYLYITKKLPATEKNVEHHE